MSGIIEFPGVGLVGHTSKKAGRELIAATLNQVTTPLSVAGTCRNELRVSLKPIEATVLHRGYLAAAKFNHGEMLSRAALVCAAEIALMPVAYPQMIATPTITAESAFAMLSVLFRNIGKPKNVETATLIAAAVDSVAPGSNEIGAATELWRPVSTHPVILALAVRKLITTAVFSSVCELHQAMREAHASIVHLANAVERWLNLLRTSDRVVFEHDRVGWDRAYEDIGLDVVREMKETSEQPEIDDDGNKIPASERWAALDEIEARKAGRASKGGHE